jgi:hypothetical protein
MAVFNVVGIILAYLIYGDRVYRVNYWNAMGFVSTTSYYPFLYTTSAVKGAISIPGLLTVDWLQVIIVVMVIVDGMFAFGYLRNRAPSPEAAPPA